MNFVHRDVGIGISQDPAGRVLSQISRRKWPIRYDSIDFIAISLDIATITLASFSSCFLYEISEGMSFDFGLATGSAALVAALVALLLKSQGQYKPTELLMLRRQARLIFIAWAAIFLMLSGIVFALKIGSMLSRGTSLLFAGMTLVGLVANRAIMWQLLTRGLADQRFSGRKIVLITEASHGHSGGVGQTLATVGFEIARDYDLPPPGAGSNSSKQLIGNVIEYIRGSDVEEVVVAADPNRWLELRALASELRVLPFPIMFVPAGSVSDIFRRPHRDLGDTVCVELQRGPLSQIEHLIKRFVDLVGAGIGLLVLAPLLAGVAVAIKLDSPGPVLFRQQRLGFNGRSFQICKFRTMTVLEEGDSVVQACAADSRVTRLGRWLRRTSIDELPQLFNVLGGSMSLVGPRPHAVVHDNQFDTIVRNYAFRSRVKPGVTGWAQVNGFRGPTPTPDLIERRVEYDLWYIDNWNLKLDFMILFQTPLEVIRGRNAY